MNYLTLISFLGKIYYITKYVYLSFRISSPQELLLKAADLSGWRHFFCPGQNPSMLCFILENKSGHSNNLLVNFYKNMGSITLNEI